jgi:hypothetical protein
MDFKQQLSNDDIGQWSGLSESCYQRATSDKRPSNVMDFDCPLPPHSLTFMTVISPADDETR